ncbi:MAG: hypothetical protein WC526_03555 [Patescibacteria group bacterium]
MQWGKAIGYGVFIWVLMFVIVSVFIGFNIYGSTWMEILIAIIGGIIVYIMAGKVKPTTSGMAVGYGVTWAVCSIILDLIVTMRFNPAIFSNWVMWLGYAIVIFVPLLQVKKGGASATPTGNETI